MPLNPFFLHGSPSEQRLVQDLINEHLKMFGQDVLYMPRRIVNEQTVIKEITASRFDDSFRLEAYLVNFDGFGSPSEILTKFGVRSQDEIQLVISKERYDDFISPLLKLWPEDEIKVATRPQEGDLIYLPLDNALFEIKFVETKVPFYQLNDLYMYELRCEIFEYEDEVIDLPDTLAGVNGDEVMEPIAMGGQVLSLQLAKDTYNNATASVSLASTIFGTKSVQYIQLFNDGNYKSTPSVYVSKPTRGNQATGIATAVNGRVKTVNIDFGGTNYIQIPQVTFTPPNRTVATQTKFGNNSLYHDNAQNTEQSRFEFPTNIDSRDTEDGRLSLSMWFYPTTFSPNPSYGGVILWSDRIKLYHRESGTVVFASGSTSIENPNPLTLNAWNFIRIEQYDSNAKLCVNGNPGSEYSNADPIMFFANNQLHYGADASGLGKLTTINDGYIGYLDHVTLNLTGDTSFRTASESLIPTTTSEQEIDTPTSKTSQFVENFNNEYPEVYASLNDDREVSGLQIVYGGSGYISSPLMTIEKPDLGQQATAVAIMTSRTGVSNKAIDRILLINPGTGYTTPPSITFTGGKPTSVAIATAIVSTGVLGVVGIDTAGFGYNFNPTVGITSVFVPQSSDTSDLIKNAQAESVVSTGSSIVQIRFSNAGTGYTAVSPSVDIQKVTSPFFGDFLIGEPVRGVSSGTSALVVSWDSGNRILKLGNVTGDFQYGETIVGAASSYTVATANSNFEGNEFASNDEIEFEADNIIDFTERNPFGEV
jgi:hypothetical protein